MVIHHQLQMTCVCFTSSTHIQVICPIFRVNISSSPYNVQFSCIKVLFSMSNVRFSVSLCLVSVSSFVYQYSIFRVMCSVQCAISRVMCSVLHITMLSYTSIQFSIILNFLRHQLCLTLIQYSDVHINLLNIQFSVASIMNSLFNN